MADVSVNERDSFMATPTLKSNAGDRKVCKKKKLSWMLVIFIEKSAPRDHCLALLGEASWCQTMTLGRIFLSAPHTHERFLYSIQLSYASPASIKEKEYKILIRPLFVTTLYFCMLCKFSFGNFG